MVYDSQRAKLVLFGGRGITANSFGDTWEWDGSVWKRMSTSGPDPRTMAGMAYDSARGKTVLFGGYSIDDEYIPTYYGDTWEWDGSAWRQVATAGPEPRHGMAMCYDSARARVVLFGGRKINPDNSTSYCGDTWEWDGSAWAQVAADGPSSRTASMMAYDSQRAKTILFGGSNYIDSYDDTWEWDGSAWRQASVAGPGSRGSAAMTYDSQRGRILLYGGSSYDEYAGETMFHGDTWEWDRGPWRALATDPEPRDGVAMAYDDARAKTILFGGATDTVFFADTWEWNGRNWRIVPTTGPPARADAAMAYDSARGKSVLFGGRGASFCYGDTWEWDGYQWHQVATTGPTARFGAVMIYDAVRKKIVLFGGADAFSNPDLWIYFGDTWEWDGTSWEQIAVTGPSERYYASMAYDSSRGQALFFGGANETSGYMGATWTYDGRQWTEIWSSSATPRCAGAMAFDPARGKAVLFGGMWSDGFYIWFLEDTQEWSGDDWLEVDAYGPSRRAAPAMVFDNSREETVLFGGSVGYRFLGDTWVYRPQRVTPPFTLPDAVRALECAAGLVTASEADNDRCNVESEGGSAGRIDMLDAARIARKVAGLEANP